jgi:hypothetical protein
MTSMKDYKLQTFQSIDQLRCSIDWDRINFKLGITSRFRRASIIASFVILVISSGIIPVQLAQAQKAGSSPKIQHGIVVGVEKVALKDYSMAGGALIGGTLGRFTSTSNRSSGSKRRRGVAGAAIGGAIGAIASSTKPKEGTQYTVKVDSGTIKVVTDQKDIRKNECVTVEQSGNEANIRRASPEVCKPGSKVVVEQLKPEFQEEADECLAVKKELMAAKTNEQIDQAVRKVKIICEN